MTKTGLLAGFALALLLATLLPLFLCMPRWCDSTIHDICARSVLRGDHVYEEVLYHSVPGMILAQTAGRALVGWRNEALRLVDFLVATGIIALLVFKVMPAPTSSTARICTAFVLYLFYLSTDEWCHCQPDTWMLLPATAALCLRQRQVLAVEKRGAVLRSLAEGVCWGLAFLIKPFVAVPALGCILLSVPLGWRPARSAAGTTERWPAVLRRLAGDAVGIFIGGLLVGALAVAWLWLSGNWPAFLDATFGGWNEDYFQYSTTLASRTELIIYLLRPWCFVHLAALPLAGVVIVQALRQRADDDHELASQALLATLYLGWFVEANYVQQQFDYHLVPPLLLAITFLGGQREFVGNPLVRCILIPGFVLWTLAVQPLLQPKRFEMWGRCWREGSSVEVRDRLTVAPHAAAPTWADLERVAQFLKEQGVRDRDVQCYNASTLSLYMELDIKPATRFLMPRTALFFMRSRRDQIVHELQTGPQKFLVTDLRDFKIARDPDEPVLQLSDSARAEFPYNRPIVFRAGRYLVHRMTTGN